MRILLTERGVEALNAPIPEHDELSNVLRRMHTQLMGNMLMVTPDDWALLQQYAEDLARGEQSTRARAILEGAEKG